MSSLKFLSFIFILSLSGLSALKAEDIRLYLITAHSPDLVAIVDNSGKVEWSVNADNGIVHPQDAAVTEEGIFSSIIPGALMFSREDKSILWRYDVPEGAQNPVAQPLDNGYYLVGNEGPCRLIEINRTGQVRREVTITDPPFKGNHGQFRFCRKTPEGTYLFPMNGAGLLREYSAEGDLIREFPITGQPIGAARLPNGNTLAGMDSTVREYNKEMKTVWEFDCVRDAGINPGLITSVCRLTTGTTLISYYSGDPDTPDIIEISPEKKILRKITLPDINQVAGMELLNSKGKPSEEILAR